MAQAFLSEVELYYTNLPLIGNKISIEGEECHHILNVMRHKIDDTLYITGGTGTIYKTSITAAGKNVIETLIVETVEYENKFSNIWFCVPRLKSPDRFEFALEKSVELGITNFIVFDSQRTVAKGEKIERWEKILLAAMKQSLRPWLPKIQYVKSIKEIVKLSGTKIFFDQNAEKSFQQFLSTINSQFSMVNYYFIFGPEGGFTEAELSMENLELGIKLAENRLRSETAIVTAAAVLASKL